MNQNFPVPSLGDTSGRVFGLHISSPALDEPKADRNHQDNCEHSNGIVHVGRSRVGGSREEEEDCGDGAVDDRDPVEQWP